MKAPARLQALIAEGLIDSVVRQLKSGKEADVYVVRCGGETCAAKIYKEAHKRSFRQAVDYTENRKVRNSRQARAMAKRTTYGRAGFACATHHVDVGFLAALELADDAVDQAFGQKGLEAGGGFQVRIVVSKTGRLGFLPERADSTPPPGQQHTHAALVIPVPLAKERDEVAFLEVHAHQDVGSPGGREQEVAGGHSRRGKKGD